MQRTYNTFYAGVKQDDYLTGGANFIEYKNLDGIQDGYGITLGPKINKQLLTNGAIRGIDGLISSTGTLTRVYAGGDNGEIYKLTSSDLTPEFTLTSLDNIVGVFNNSNDLYFFTKASLSSVSAGASYITESNANNGDWNLIDESFIISGTMAILDTAVAIIDGSYLYLSGSRGAIKKIDSTGVTDTYSFADDYIVGLTVNGATVTVYSRTGSVYFWDGGSTNYSSKISLGSRIKKVTQNAGLDYVITEDGQLYIGSGYTFQNISTPKKSYRQEDNSIVQKRLDFTNNGTDNPQNKSLIPAKNDIYLYSSDSVKGIYKYGSLINGLNPGFNKIITSNYNGDDIDTIYDMFYYSTIGKLFFSYKAGDTYGIDYIDLNSLDTTTDGYGITDVFAGGTTLDKKINTIRIATSNTSGDNYIKLSYRIDNGEWEEIRTINDTTDIINNQNIHTMVDNSSFKKFIDIQFKVELHRGGNNTPILHELMLDYDIIET